MKRMWIAFALWGAVGLQAQTADHAPLQLQGDGPYYRLRLPLGIFERAGYSSLDDLRVRNASGLDVPMAWIDGIAPEAETKEQAVPIFALRASSTASKEPESMPVVIRTDGSLSVQRQAGSAPTDGPWLMDLSKLTGRLLRAHFEIPADARGLFQFQLDASDDLKHWHTAREDGQLLRLSQAGDLLERLSLDLFGVQARYLRLRWNGVGVPLKSVHIESLQDAAALPALEWATPIVATQCTADHCDYRLPRNLPAQALRINLAEVNTLARIEVIGLQDRASHERPGTQHRRHVLRALRHSQQPATPSTDALEQALYSTTVFRLQQPGGEALSGDLPLSGDVYAGLRLRTTGPAAQLGAKPPTLSLAVLPRSLVFLTQGQGPFSLTWVPQPSANLTMKPGPYLPIAELQRDGKAESMGVASVALPAFAAAAPASVASDVTAAAPQSHRKVWLWGVMGIGLVLLALMARSLLRGLDKEPQDPAP